jgi:uncharacterized membrane protein YkvA (DUF1232 family)
MSSPKTKSSMRNWNPEAVLRDLATAWRLFWDPKVPSMLKFLLPIAALVYWFFPIDLLPFNPIDDIALLILALRLFVQMASPAPATQASGPGRQSSTDDANTIDTTWRVIDNR